MKSTPLHRGYSRPAFTLIEIITVIAIIMILAAMTISGLGWATKKAEIKRTTILIASIENTLTQYYDDNDAYPEGGDGGTGSSVNVYKALYGDQDLDGKPDDEARVYLPTLNPENKGKALNIDTTNHSIIDAWKNEIRYRHSPDGNDPNMMNPDFDLWSQGPDKAGYPDGSADERLDDINNWK